MLSHGRSDPESKSTPRLNRDEQAWSLILASSIAYLESLLALIPRLI